jgi:hypothetical protein
MIHRQQAINFEFGMNNYNLNEVNNVNSINSFASVSSPPSLPIISKGFSGDRQYSQVLPSYHTQLSSHPYGNPAAHSNHRLSPSNLIASPTHSALPQALPSFNELLTSIPLAHEFREPVTSRLNYTIGAKITEGHNYPITFFNSSSRNNSLPSNSVQTQAIHHPLQSPKQSPNDTRDRSPNYLSSNYSLPNSISKTLPSPQDPQLSDLSSDAPVKLVSSRKYACKTCSRSFTTSGHLARHNRIHTGERKNVCPWPTCEARFARQDNCMQHYKTHTNGKSKKLKFSTKRSSRPKSR